VKYIICGASVMLLLLVSLAVGSVNIPLSEVFRILLGGASSNPAWNIIVLESRWPQTVTACLSGAALAVSGLMLQTLFRNPLAGPSILGVSDGANLGVALVMLYGGGVTGFGMNAGGYMAVITAAFVGAAAILAVIIYFSNRLNNAVMLLIIGIMIGYLASSAITILNWTAAADQVHQYVMWGMGDFTSVSTGKLPWFCGTVTAGIILSLLLMKPLNALLLGNSYAANLGVNLRSTRTFIFLSAGLLTASVTAFCGPVSFIGLAVPHIARLLYGSSDHRHLLPMTILTGSAVALTCNILTAIPIGGTVLPLNAVTPIIGAPVIIYVIMNRRNLHYFN